MPTDLDIDRAIQHLNYPLLQWAYTLLQSRMNEVSSISSAAENRIITILDNLDSVEAARLAYTLASSGVQVLPGGTVYYRAAKLSELNRELSVWRTELSIILSVPIWHSSSTSVILS